MKRSLTRFLPHAVCVVLAVLCQTASHGGAPRSYALLIGITHFQDPGIPSLPYVSNDLRLAERMARRFGFSDIRQLVDENAQSYKIKDALDRLARDVRSGDRVLIYVSTHGTKKLQRNNTLQSALLTYDRAMTLQDWSRYTDEIRSKGVRLFFIADACYAASTIRGVGSGSLKYVPGDEVPASALGERNVATASPYLGDAVMAATDKDQIARATLVDAATHEMASAYTLAWYRASFFNPTRLGQRFTYLWLDQQIAPHLDQDIRRQGQPQTPWTKTQHPDDLVFDRTPSPAGIPAQVNGPAVLLEEGRFAGLRPGDLVELYSPAAPSICIAKVQVSFVDEFSAQARITRRYGPVPARCLAEPSRTLLPRLIAARFITRTAQGKAAEEALTRLDADLLDKDPASGSDAATEAVVTFGGDARPAAEVAFSQPALHLSLSGADPEATARRVSGLLKDEALGDVIRQLKDASPGEFSLTLTSDQPQYALGEHARYTLKADRPCFVHLFDVGTSGTVTQLVPYGDLSGQMTTGAYRVPGDDSPFAIEESGGPGDDLLVAIATSRPLPSSQPISYAVAILTVNVVSKK